MTGGPFPDRSSRRTVVRLTLAALLVLIVVAHLPLRNAEYIQDDHVAIEQNPIVARGDVGEIFATSYWAGYWAGARGSDTNLYRPLTVLSYALEYRAAGRPDPRLAHAVNLVLHVLATLALYALASRLGAGPSAAAAAALLFAVHPVHVEAVGGIVGRAEILAALFTFSAILALSHTGAWPVTDGSAAPSAARARLAAWGTALFVFLALASKEIALAVPALLVVTELVYRPPARGRAGRWLVDRGAALAPTVLAVLVWLGLRVRALETLFAVQEAHPADNFLVLLSGTERIATALGLVVRALRLFVFPIGLSIDYSGHVIEPEQTLLAWRPLAGLLMLAVSALLIAWPLARRLRADAPSTGSVPARQLAVASALFLLPYLVIGNLLLPVGTIFAERLLYLPSAGFCLLAGITLSHLAWGYPAFPAWTTAQRARMIGTALVILLAAFSLLSWLRCTEWRDDVTVFEAATRAQPRSPRAHFALGLMASGAERHAEALEHFRRAIEVWPGHVLAHLQTGLTHAKRGDYASAERWLRATLRLVPEQSVARLNLGMTLHRQNRYREAEVWLRKTILLEPGNALAWAELGNVRLGDGRHAAAAEAYRRAVALGRDDLDDRLREAERRAGLSGTVPENAAENPR